MWRGRWSFAATTAYRLLRLELLATSPERLRKCPRENYKNPYFIARHLREKCCSDECKAWAQRRSKALWWREKGDKRRRRPVAHHQESKFEVGTSTNFFVVQAQRDVATAQDTELRALLDYQKALVDFERAQQTSQSGARIIIVSGGGGGG